MITFLTSSFIEYQTRKEYKPEPIDESNGFGDNLRKYWKKGTHFLMFASDPADSEMVDHTTEELYDAFTLSGFEIEQIRYFDDRSIGEDDPREVLEKYLLWADVLYLSGGHAPTQNAFMKRCHLKELLSRAVFDGIVIALSAGMVNSAEEAYLIPELDGEAIDPSFVRFTDGLGLTSLKTLPHAQFFKDKTLDGLDVITQIVAGDSYGREVYLLNDGSYFMINNGVTEFFGEGQVVCNGRFRKLKPGIINIDNKSLRETADSHLLGWNDILEASLDGAYEFVFRLDLDNGRLEFLKISRYFLSRGFLPVSVESFERLNEFIAEKLIVKEEREAFLDQISMETVLYEIERTGSYVRAIHLHTDDGIRGHDYRIKPMAQNSRVLLGCLTDIQLILDHDCMTDIYSRTGFLARAEEILTDIDLSEGYSLIYTNIKGFKVLNDRLGTFAGDMIIFSQRDLILRCFDPVLIARLESEHFAAIVKNEYLTGEKLNILANQYYDMDSKRYPYAIRCGICPLTAKDDKINKLLDKAKLAENSIPPERSRTYAYCDENLMDDYIEQRMMISELDRALKENEFKAYYQPIVDARTHEVVSAEALIRWEHPGKGLISPGQFIPVFERSGLISKIDNFMVNSVLDFNINRLKEGKRTVPVAVNLSRVDFYDTGLLSSLKENMSKIDRISEMIKLEVTESAYAALERDAMDFLRQMKELKLPLLLDDFGSGMSSLSTLQSFDFDIIKLDMGFIRKIGTSEKTEAIIKYIIDLSHALGARVVAEGVETKEQLSYLTENNCDMIQGYYFYKPMPAEEFTKVLK